MAGRADGQRSRAVIVAATSASESSERDELVRWYREIHAPAVRAVAGVHSCEVMLRHLNNGAREPRLSLGAFDIVAVYEVDEQDKDDIMSRITAALREVGGPPVDVTTATFAGVYVREAL